MAVLVIGGVNMDLGGRSRAPLVAGDSNPGKVTASLGGVGRNIAHNLCLLGVDTALMTVLGDDDFGTAVRQNAREIGLDLSLSQTLPGQRTSTYLYLLNSDGDMALAVNDMDIYEQMTPAFLEKRLAAIQGFDLVVLDTNIPGESIRWLCRHCTVPIIADPVSTIKGEKLRDVLGELYAIKPNRAEGEMLTGEKEPEKIVEKLLAAGVKKVFLSLSTEGMAAGTASGERCRIPCPKGELVNATGGGDAMVAALTACLLRGEPLEESAKTAMAAAVLACSAETTINPRMSWENIEKLRESEE